MEEDYIKNKIFKCIPLGRKNIERPRNYGEINSNSSGGKMANRLITLNL
jgi:hypothetical protein